MTMPAGRVILHILCLLSAIALTWSKVTPRKLVGVRFVVTVNDTWAEPPGCIDTVATPMVMPDKPTNIQVGACDHGPINYTFITPGNNNNTYTISLVFHSSVIEDAEPPTCDLSWNGTYINPMTADHSNPLPSCFTMDSREGNFLTYYWFHLLEWTFE